MISRKTNRILLKALPVHGKMINMKQLIRYVGFCERALIEGELVLNANHVMLCGFSKKTKISMEIFALCLKSSDLKGKPNEINFVIKNTGEMKGDCSCKAGGRGRCKHGTAVLLYLNR